MIVVFQYFLKVIARALRIGQILVERRHAEINVLSREKSNAYDKLEKAVSARRHAAEHNDGASLSDNKYRRDK